VSRGRGTSSGSVSARASSSSAVAALPVVGGRQLDCLHQQLAQQRRHVEHLALVALARHRARLDVEAARAHAQHAHPVRLARRNPHAALRRYHPGAVVAAHLHHARGAVQELRAPVAVRGQQEARGVVGADGQHRAVDGVDRFDLDVAHAKNATSQVG
jgi:hypothetical protein